MSTTYEYTNMDCDDELRRFLGSAALYQGYLMKFLRGGSFEELRRYFEAKYRRITGKKLQLQEASEDRRTVVELHKVAEITVRAIRAGKSAEEIKPLAREVRTAYERAYARLSMQYR